MVFLMFVYILDITQGIPKRRSIRRVLEVPFMISIVVVALFVPELTYCRGDITNYSIKDMMSLATMGSLKSLKSN